MLEIAALFLAWLTFWITIGMTEGFKWTLTPEIVTAANYHIFRTVTTASVLGIALLSGLAFQNSSFLQMCILTVLLNLGTWPLYEMALNWVNWGKFFPDKGCLTVHDFLHNLLQSY
jgi:hypothetical protein